jgi:hypothetical protein
LLHAGFSVPRMLPSGRWALTPPFHPYQMRWTETGGPLVSRRPAAEVFASPAVLFSVALSVAAHSFCNEGVTPWRYQARRPYTSRLLRAARLVRCSCELRTMGVRTFLPLASLARSKPAIIRLTRSLDYSAVDAHPNGWLMKRQRQRHRASDLFNTREAANRAASTAKAVL